MAASADSRPRRKRTRRMRVCAATVGKPASRGGAPRRELVAKPLARPTDGRSSVATPIGPMTRAPAPAAESPRHRVVIVGAGFGGLFAARAPRCGWSCTWRS